MDVFSLCLSNSAESYDSESRNKKVKLCFSVEKIRKTLETLYG